MIFRVRDHKKSKAVSLSSFKIRPQDAESASLSSSSIPALPGLLFFSSSSSLAHSQLTLALRSENRHHIWPCVRCLCDELFTTNARTLEVLPLEIWHLQSRLFILSLLSGSLQQCLEYIKNLWVLSGRQLRSIFLQPIRGADLVPESPNQRAQTLCRLRRLAVQQHKLLGG